MSLQPEPVSRRDRPAKAPLSRSAILDATLALIRDHGVAAVALRDVARAVETGPASLYAYFDNRDTLLQHALDAVYSKVRLVGDAGADWRSALEATIVNTIETVTGYPGLGAVALGTVPTLPGALRLAEHELALMENGGVPAERAALAIDLIAQHVASTAVERNVRGATDSPLVSQLRDTYAAADAELFPHIRARADLLTSADETARRDFAIEALIAGIEHRAAAPW